MNAKEKTIIEYNKMSGDDKACIVHSYHDKMCNSKGLPVKGHRIAFAHTIRHTARHFHISIGSAHAYVKRGEEICISQC